MMRTVPHSKQSRWALVLSVVLIATSQLGCTGAAAPVATAVINIVYWIGQKAVESAVMLGVEKAFDHLFGQRTATQEVNVAVDPINPLQGRCAGPITLANADDKNKTYVLFDFPVYRDTIGGKWKVDPDYALRIENALKTK